MPPEMYHQEFDVPEQLQDTIKCFWYNRRDSTEAQSVFEVTPDGYAEIIFYFSGECSVAQNGILHPLPSPFMMGLLNQPVHFHMANRLEIIAVRCFPWTIFDLLELPSGKVGVHTFEHPIAQLHSTLDALIQQGRKEEAIDQLKQYFLTLRSHVSTDSMLFKAGVAMTKAKGTLPVSQVAEAAHATVRTLERKFKESSGHTVKDVSGLMRFEQARNHLWLHPDVNLAGLAVDLGYTDQSHLSREFKRYTGITPAAFAKKAKKGQRVVSNDFVAFVQS
ncbi:helix-turn-helix domain-containing protein [Chryseobacterium sp. PTM-20240506]|uniref:AraC family transcriptional regulator n=1 Tax=Chryseobacterium sp. PTM-20240506 TaxID=3400631 RepID=UPI003AAB6A19